MGGETEEVNFYNEECEDYGQGNDDGGDEPVVEEPVTEAPVNEDNSDCYSDDTYDNAGDDLGLVDYRNLNDDDNNSFEDIFNNADAAYSDVDQFLISGEADEIQGEDCEY